MRHLLFPLLLPVLMLGQSDTPQGLQAGLELDALPYATGGYFGAVWLGKGLWRARVLHASVHMPDWFVKEGFQNHRIKAYALVADRFLKPDWRGIWLGGGLVYWKSDIQTDALLEEAALNNLLLNGSLGYNIRLGRHFYLSPWGGMSLHIAGDKDIPVDNLRFTLPLLNPEASLKLGVVF